jgi:hypothetical protein
MIAGLEGVPVEIGGATVKGLLRRPDIPMFAEDELELVGRSVLVLIEGKPTGLVNEAAITVAGESMKIHRVMAESDGSVTRVLCKKA